MPQSTIIDVLREMNVSGTTTPFTIFNVGGISSGQVNDKILEADATLRGWIGNGPPDSTNATINEQVKRFEVNYAAAKLAQSIMGIMTTDGFNYAVGGLDISRFTAQHQTYTKFIDDHLEIAKYYIRMLHPWFIGFNQERGQGLNEYGNPITYWKTT